MGKIMTKIIKNKNKKIEYIKVKTPLKDVFIIKKNKFEDRRGSINKLFSNDLLKKININFRVKECILTTSKRNVLRGMHYQKYPYSQSKLITVTQGKILDVLVKINNNQNKKKIYSVILSAKNNKSLLIPKGYAHGFLTLSKMAKVCYMNSNVYNKDKDTGIHYNSFGFRWPIKKPILSFKDKCFRKYNE